MSNQIAIPEHLKKYVSAPGTSTDADAMASASISVPRISLRGRKFRLIEGGEEIRRPAEDLNVIILSVEPGAGLMQKTFYAKGYSSGDSSPPDCSSANGVTPDTWISNPVASRCNSCPKNVFGSATNANNGKKSKACKDSKRLWVVLPEAINGTVFSLSVPVTSLKAMAEYGSMLKSNGIEPQMVITRLTMKDTEFPELIFEFAGVLDEADLELSINRNINKDWDNRALPPPSEDAAPAPRTLAAPGADALLSNQSAPAETVPAKTSSAGLSADEATGSW